MKNLCLFWRLDLWYKEKFVSLEIVYFGRHATFTQVSLNCRLDTRVWPAQVCDSNWAWSLTNPTVQWRFTSFYSWGWVFEYAVVGRGPGCDILSTQSTEWQIPPSLFTVSFCSDVQISACRKTEPMQFIWCWTVLSVQSHRPPLHTLVEPTCELLPVGDMTRTALHCSPVSRDDTLSHLHFQRSLALQRDIRLLTCLDYCFFFSFEKQQVDVLWGEKWNKMWSDAQLLSQLMTHSLTRRCPALLNVLDNSRQCCFNVIFFHTKIPLKTDHWFDCRQEDPAGDHTVTQRNSLFSWNSFYSYLNIFFFQRTWDKMQFRTK